MIQSKIADMKCKLDASLFLTLRAAWAKQHAAAQEAFDRGEYDKPWPRPAAGY